MKIVFVKPNLKGFCTIEPPLGLAYLSAVAQEVSLLKGKDNKGI